MRLHSFSVQRYRSITETKKIVLGESTVLIGPNNEGKSNILRALVLAMRILKPKEYLYQRRYPRRPYSRFVNKRNSVNYDWYLDFPVDLQQSQPDGRTIFILEFELDDSEYIDFFNEVKSNITGNLRMKISIGKDGPPLITYHKKGRHSKLLSEKSELIRNFINKRIEFEHIPAVRTADSAQEIVDHLVSRELSTLENNYEYNDCIRKIVSLQKPIMVQLSKSIKQTLQQFLPDIKKVEIDVSQADTQLAFRSADVFIDDGTKTPLSFKGDGVQSLAALGIIRYFSERQYHGKQFVVAIEEPESHLHPDAIHKLKQVTDDLSKKHQVIITSHNPIFVDLACPRNEYQLEC